MLRPHEISNGAHGRTQAKGRRLLHWWRFNNYRSPTHQAQLIQAKPLAAAHSYSRCRARPLRGRQVMAQEFSLELKPCPTEGQGVHRWIDYAACTLADAGVPSEDAEAIIEELMTRPPKTSQ